VFNVDMGGATAQSIDFNGTDEILAHDTELALGFTDTFSISVWVKGTSNVGGSAAQIVSFLKSGDSSNQIQLGLLDDSNGSKFSITIRDSSDAAAKNFEFGSYTVDTWTMLTITLNGATDTLTVYQDGVDVTSGATKTTDATGYTMTDTTRRVQVGSDATDFFEGLVYSPATWTTVLGADEVAEIESNASTQNLRCNGTDYMSTSTLNHLWDNRVSTSIGQDYQNQTSGAKRDIITDAVNIGIPDIDSDVP
jgi:hypothetical protein